MYVADINHIYSANNWKKVKPYPGLIVSAPDGEVRICVNADYTLESSWKKIGGGAVSVATNATFGKVISHPKFDKYPFLIFVYENTTGAIASLYSQTTGEHTLKISY